VVRAGLLQLIGQRSLGIPVERIARSQVPVMPEIEALHCSRVAKPQPRIPEVLVEQYSPACAAGDANATKASAESAADAVMIFWIDFIVFFLFKT
jgi:hypothetical protein